MLKDIKDTIQLLIDYGAIAENKNIKMFNCEGNMWSYHPDEDKTLKVVTTENGLDLLQIPNITLHTGDGEMVVGINSDEKEMLIFFMERADEYDS